MSESADVNAATAETAEVLHESPSPAADAAQSGSGGGGAEAAAAATTATNASATTSATAASPWSFNLLEGNEKNPLFSNFNSKATQELLEKWGMKQWTYARRFQFAGPWAGGRDADAFITAFLNDAGVQGRLQVATKRELVPLVGRVEKVQIEPLRATVTNMNFFDKLTSAGVVKPSGHINRTCVRASVCPQPPPRCMWEKHNSLSR